MLKLHRCVPNYCEDLLQHGRGTKFSIFLVSIFLVHKLLSRNENRFFAQMGFPLCTSPPTARIGSLYAN